MAVDKVKALNTALVDTRSAYELAAQKAESPRGYLVVQSDGDTAPSGSCRIASSTPRSGETPDETAPS
jgi:hypothetical protein